MPHNGPNRLILPATGPILGGVPPQQGVQLEVTPLGIVAVVSAGNQSVTLTLNPAAATQLGVNLISVAALLANAQQQAAPTLAHPINPTAEPTRLPTDAG